MAEDTGTLIPPTGFVKHFVSDYVQAPGRVLTDASTSYLVAVAYMQLATALMDVIDVDYAGEKPPNLCLMLVGESTLHRKTTAIELALQVLRVTHELGDFVGLNEYSAESLIKNLAELPTKLLPMPEMGDFLTLAHTWGERLKPLLQQLVDAPAVYTKELTRGGPIEIYNPRVSILAAITPAQLSEIRGTQLDWHGGFFARFLFIMPGDATGKINLEVPQLKRGRPCSRNAEMTAFLHNRLIVLRRAAQQLGNGKRLLAGQLTPEAETLLSAWLDYVEQINDPIYMRDGLGRVLHTLIKIAALLAFDLSDGTSILINEDAIRYAGRFVLLALQSKQAVANQFAPTNEARTLQRITAHIQRAGAAGISYAKLLRNSHLKAKDLREYLETLTLSEQINNEKGCYYMKDVTPE